MSHPESEEYIDTMSSGDCNKMRSQIPKSKEVNNNEVDELSKELSEMGCVVDAMKRPPNICVETCVYESDSENSQTNDDDHNEDAYSDEFEEEEEESIAVEEKSSKTNSIQSQPNPSTLKLSKSQSSTSSNKPPASISGGSRMSTDYGLVQKLVPRNISVEWRCGITACRYHRGRPLTESVEQWAEMSQRSLPSVSVPSRHRVNMTFSNDRLRDIERHNHILLTKILSARNTRKSSIPSKEQHPRRQPPSAAVLRKNHQRQIDHDNLILLKKIQRAKSSAYSVRR